MILLIQQRPHLHSRGAKREEFFNKFDSKLRSIPNLWRYKFDSKASLKCFCNKIEATHEASLVNSNRLFMFLLLGISDCQVILIEMLCFLLWYVVCVFNYYVYLVLVLIPKLDCNFLFWFRAFLLCHGMPLGIRVLHGVHLLCTFSVCIFLWALEACLWFPN